MVQTELIIGSEMTPHYQDRWWYTTVLTTHRIVMGQDVTNTYTNTSFFSPGSIGIHWVHGRGTPEEPWQYDTGVTLDGVRISIQDDCGIYPTHTIYPQDGSKFHLEITGNHTASVDVTPSNPYTMRYDNTTSDITWIMTWSMSQDYTIRVEAERITQAQSYYTVDAHIKSSMVGTDVQKSVDSRINPYLDVYSDNTFDGTDKVLRLNLQTNELLGYDPTTGTLIFQDTLASIETDKYFAAFYPTTDNIYGVYRDGNTVYVTPIYNAGGTRKKYMNTYKDGVLVASDDNELQNRARITYWYTQDVVETGCLVVDVTCLHCTIYTEDSNTFEIQCLNYQNAAGGLKKNIVFDPVNNPDGTTVTIGDYTPRFAMTVIDTTSDIMSMYIGSAPQGDSDSDSDDDEEVVPLDNDTDIDTDV